MDNCASYSMTFSKKDFISEIRPPTISNIQGAGGLCKVHGSGTIKYIVEDDNNIPHELIVENALFVPDIPFRLFAVNQFSQQKENTQYSEGTGIYTYRWH